ncbi:MAG: NUDIX domain-containing protein [Bacteroidales bacterium]|jgi:8-oxo-dGTP diphosphatase|nr:NUDIX domain-containing protein [Bacteroidales bacterium]
MKNKFHITYHPVNSIELNKLTYVIIGAREKGKWIFVRNRDRISWELPSGHLEENETALEAAKRELYEETGTLKSSIRAIHDYSVKSNGDVKSGRIFFAEIIDRGPLPVSVIAEIKIQQISPEHATYPEAHESFVHVLNKFIGQQQP